ncbi:translation initiation factor 2 [Pseudomonas sp. 3A(2025)]
MPVAPVLPSTVPSTLDKPVADVVTGSVASKPAAPVHELTPNVPVVPVVIGKGDSGVAPKPAEVRSDKGSKVARASVVEEKKTSANKPAAKAVSKREEQVQKRQAAKTAAVAKETGLGKTRLDLSLPPELVQELEPPPKVITARRKPLLPPMFGDKASSSDPEGFELNGRLLSNEMQLQMRNESRREVEGAALDFKFKQ